jgi:UDP-N-acetylbacillosamine N-acetyltransferase
MRPKIIVWGASGHALVVVDILRLRNEYDIIGFIDDLNSNRRGQQVIALPVLGGREQFLTLRSQGVTHLIFGFGDCAARFELASLVDRLGFESGTAIHPGAIVANSASIGAGSVIAAGAVVGAGAIIGRHCIINTCASVDHECIIGDAAHVGPGVRLGGRVRIESAAWVGIGATILDNIRVGAHSIVGAGAVVTKDVPTSVVVYGVPAKTVRAVPS